MTPRDVVREWAAKVRPPCLAEHYGRASRDRRDAIDDAVMYRSHGLAGPHLMGYPTPDVGAAIILGASPRDVAPGLTRAEARAYVSQTEHATPMLWLAASVRARHGVDVGRSDYLEVWRWVDRMMSSGRADAMRRNERLHRIDELIPSDLTDSVRETFRLAVIRQALAEWDGPDELIPHQPWHDELPAGVRVLRTARELFYEGRTQEHCVGSYARRVYARECIIASVSVGTARSTAEIVGDRVVQHRGARNAPPPPECVRLLGTCRWS